MGHWFVLNLMTRTLKQESATVPTLPPGPRRLVPGLNFYRFRTDTLRFLQRVAVEYGDIVYFKIGPQSAYFLNHPDYIKDVLVTSNNSFIKGRALQRSKRLFGEGLL